MEHRNTYLCVTKQRWHAPRKAITRLKYALCVHAWLASQLFIHVSTLES